MNFKQLIALLLLLFLLATCKQQLQKEDEPVVGVLGKNGMVASAHPIASQVGLDILKQGGNAYDALVAVHFALAVVYPSAGNIGGGGFLVYRKADGTTGALDFREKAPMAGHRDMYLDEKKDVIEGLSRRGHLAAGVPGSVAGMFAIHEKLCSMPMDSLIQPALDLAANGFPLTENEANKLNGYRETFLELNTVPPEAILEDTLWEKGEIISYPDLAKTLARIREKGAEGFYQGETARLIVEEMERGNGIISLEDLANYEAVWRNPILGTYKNYQVISMSPPSSGGIALMQLLKGSSYYDFQGWGHNTAPTAHHMVELERRVYADRATHLGDADFYDVPTEMLISKEYIEQRISSIDPEKKTDSQEIKAGEVASIESFETTHYSIVDKEGNAASVTTTLNGGFGNKVMVGGAGFFLNNEMDDFSIKPGVPNMFGLVGGEANAIAPEKRMLSSMTPTILEKDGELFMVVGTPGGSTIITSVYQTILNVVEHGMTMQEAVNAKKFHSQWLPDQVYAEEHAFDSLTLEKLREMGHEISVNPERTLGRMDCILVRPDGTYEGASDYTRADNTSLGY